MAQAPRTPTHEDHPNPTHPGSQPGQSQQQNPASSQGQAQQGQPGQQSGSDPQPPLPGQPGSQRLSPSAGAGTVQGPPPERPGVVRNPGERQSMFENQPGQQIPGLPAHEGHEEDRQHLRGRTIQEGQAVEDKEPKPRGVPRGAIQPGRMGTEQPDAPPPPKPGQVRQPEEEMEREREEEQGPQQHGGRR